VNLSRPRLRALLAVIRGHSASKARVNALVTRASNFRKMNYRVNPGNDVET
jgi:hypothetical protein